MIVYSLCPCCSSTSISKVLAASDHTVSHDSFDIWECASCTVRFTQNVPDVHGIAKYYASEDYISHSDTKEGLINSLYHKVRRMTLRRKKVLVSKACMVTKGSVLDIGCGTGAFLHAMAKAGWAVKGLEPDPVAREKAKQLYGQDLDLPEALFRIPAHSFDAITMWHVLEHVHQLHEYIEQLKKILKPKGKLFIAVPNYRSLDAKYYKEHWAGYDVPRHLYHFSPLAMQGILGQHGFQILKMKPMWYDSFYVSMLSEKYRNGKGNILRAFVKGYLSNIKAFFNVEKCSSVIYIAGKV